MSLHIESTRPFSPRRLAWLLVAAVLVSGAAAADDPIIAAGVASEGHVMLIGDKQQWDTVVGSEDISSASGFLSLAHDDDETAVNLSWNGGGEAQFFVGRKEAGDYSAYLDQDAALVAVIRVDKQPTGKATLRMGCGYPCGSNADITKLLNALPTDKWVRVSFDLKCFADGGLDARNVDTPWLITTKGELGLSIAELSVAPEIGTEATIRCRD